METLDALNQAMKRELDGQKFYSEAATKSSSQKGRKMFEWLAQEESGHIQLLEQAISEMKDNDQWLTQDMWGSSGHISEPVNISEIPTKPETMGEIAPNASELEILAKAIEAEKADATFYKTIAADVTDPSGRIMVEKLAHVEKGHQTLLEEEYYWLRHSKDLFTLHRFLPAG